MRPSVGMTTKGKNAGKGKAGRPTGRRYEDSGASGKLDGGYGFGAWACSSDWRRSRLFWLTRMKPRVGVSRSEISAITMEIISGATSIERTKRRRRLNPKLRHASRPIIKSMIQTG